MPTERSTFEETIDLAVALLQRAKMIQPSQPTRPAVANFSVLVTVVEAADLLRISRSQVFELLRSGELPSLKIGRSRRVRRVDVEAFAAMRVAASSQRRLATPSG